MVATTRFGLAGFGVQPDGSFSGRDAISATLSTREAPDTVTFSLQTPLAAILTATEAPDVALFVLDAVGAALLTLAAGEPVDVCSIIAFNSTPFMKETWVQIPPKASGGWVEDQE